MHGHTRLDLELLHRRHFSDGTGYSKDTQFQLYSGELKVPLDARPILQVQSLRKQPSHTQNVFT